MSFARPGVDFNGLERCCFRSALGKASVGDIKACCETFFGCRNKVRCIFSADNGLWYDFAVKALIDPMVESFRESKRKFTVLIERDEEGFYVATVPGLPGCHTQAKNLDTLMQRAGSVIALCLEAERSDIGRLELVGIQQIYV